MRLSIPLVVLTAAFGFGLPGCKLFKTSGSACIADTNCPSSQVCCGGVCSASCDDGGTINATVSLATDYVPGYEFDKITIDVDGITHEKNHDEKNVTVVTELMNPRVISLFSGLGRGDHAMTLVLSHHGSDVAARIISFNSTHDVKVPFVITHECDRVRCGGDTSQCLGGECVSSACSESNLAACPNDYQIHAAPFCAYDTDCTSAVLCSVGVCIGGVCMQRGQDQSCKDTERCVPNMGSGCVAQDHECDPATAATDCNDLASCTQKQCNNNRCSTIRDDSQCGTTVCDPTDKTADPNTGCTKAVCDPKTTCVAGPCETATCSDAGECQRTSKCGTGQRCCNNECAVICDIPHACVGHPAGYECRSSMGACDPPEQCNGGDECPPDVIWPATHECRPAKPSTDGALSCDAPEYCDGTSAQCPAEDKYAAPNTPCRPAADPACDVAEVCTGMSPTCPTDLFKSTATQCRAAQSVCDKPAFCTGSSASCPPNGFKTAADPPCRTHTSGNDCELDTYCPGNSLACPTTIPLKQYGTVCRYDSIQLGICAKDAICNGTSGICPATTYQTSSYPCRPAADICDVAENCTGSSAACPTYDAKKPQSTQCRAATDVCGKPGVCDGVNNYCPANGFQPTTTVCGTGNNICNQRYCNGYTASCPTNNYPAIGTHCGATGTCIEWTCDGVGGCSMQKPYNVGAICYNDNTCLAHACDSSGNCAQPVAQNEGAWCDQGVNMCSTHVCHAGGCMLVAQNIGVTCGGSSNPCVSLQCDQNGNCSEVPITNYTPCTPPSTYVSGYCWNGTCIWNNDGGGGS